MKLFSISKPFFYRLLRERETHALSRSTKKGSNIKDDIDFDCVEGKREKKKKEEEEKKNDDFVG